MEIRYSETLTDVEILPKKGERLKGEGGFIAKIVATTADRTPPEEDLRGFDNSA